MTRRLAVPAPAASPRDAARAPTFARGAAIAVVRGVGAVAGCGAHVGAASAGLLNVGAWSREPAKVTLAWRQSSENFG